MNANYHDLSIAAKVALPAQSALQTQEPETNSQIPRPQIQIKSSLNQEDRNGRQSLVKPVNREDLGDVGSTQAETNLTHKPKHPTTDAHLANVPGTS